MLRFLKSHFTSPRVANHCIPRTISQPFSCRILLSAWKVVPCISHSKFLHMVVVIIFVPSATEIGKQSVVSVPKQALLTSSGGKEIVCRARIYQDLDQLPFHISSNSHGPIRN